MRQVLPEDGHQESQVQTDYLLEGYDGEDIAVLGETSHITLEHKIAEHEAVEEIEPETVALEALQRKEKEYGEEQIRKYGHHLSLRNISEYMFGGFEDSDFLKDEAEIIEDIEQTSSERPYAVPDTSEELYSIPLSFLNSCSTGIISDAIESQAQEEAEEFEKWMSEEERQEYEPKDLDDKIQQLHVSSKIVDELDQYSWQLGAVIEPLYRQIQRDQEAKLVGCDNREEARRKGETQQQINEMREEHMHSKLEEYSKESQANRPVLGVIGKGHLQGVKENNESGVIETIFSHLRGDKKPSIHTEKLPNPSYDMERMEEFASKQLK